MGTVLCFSGGLDSLIAWFYLNKPKAIYFAAGHRYEQKEWLACEALMRQIPDLKVIRDTSLFLKPWEQGDKAFIKNRNLLYATIASNYGNKIVMAGIKGDNISDKSPEAFQAMTGMLDIINPSEKYRVYSPFWEMSKTDIIKWYIGAGHPKEHLRASVSCYTKDEEGQCGICASCFRKWVALESAGISCQSWFTTSPAIWPGAKVYKVDMLNGKYDKQRTEETLAVLEKYGV